MYSRGSRTPQKTPQKETPKKLENRSGSVAYFYHFAKNLLRPYGQAGFGVDNETLQDKLNVINCEFYNRPSYAISFMADTVLSNLEGLAEYADFSAAVSQMIVKIEKLKPYFQAVENNHKDKSKKTYDESLSKVLEFLTSERTGLNHAIANHATYSRQR